MAPKFALFTKGSKLPLNKGFKICLSYYSLAHNPRNMVNVLKFQHYLVVYFFVCLLLLLFFDINFAFFMHCLSDHTVVW